MWMRISVSAMVKWSKDKSAQPRAPCPATTASRPWPTAARPSDTRRPSPASRRTSPSRQGQPAARSCSSLPTYSAPSTSTTSSSRTGLHPTVSLLACTQQHCLHPHRLHRPRPRLLFGRQVRDAHEAARLSPQNLARQGRRSSTRVHPKVGRGSHTTLRSETLHPASYALTLDQVRPTSSTLQSVRRLSLPRPCTHIAQDIVSGHPPSLPLQTIRRSTSQRVRPSYRILPLSHV